MLARIDKDVQEGLARLNPSLKEWFKANKEAAVNALLDAPDDASEAAIKTLLAQARYQRLILREIERAEKAHSKG